LTYKKGLFILRHTFKLSLKEHLNLFPDFNLLKGGEKNGYYQGEAQV
jgi:hypothetical protein